MTYLASPRLVCSGRFLSDVSTRNNNNSNYGSTDPTVDEWNKYGGATFEPLDCRVTGGTGIATDDPVAGYVLTGGSDRPSAKMVDLDPDCQWASEIWGLTLRLIDPGTQELAFSGEFEVASFRELFTRQVRELLAGGVANGQPSGARFVSALKRVSWGPAADRSPLLSSLRRQTRDDRLSVALQQFGYFYTQGHALYRTGSLICIIGPSSADEPATCIAARRLQQVVARELLGGITLVGAIDFEVDGARSVVSLDVGHAMLIDNYSGTITDLSTLDERLASVRGLAVGFALDPGSTVPELLGDLPILEPGWYRSTGGVVDIALTADNLAAATSRRFALYARLANGSVAELSQETGDGVLIRADTFVRRLDPGDTTTVNLHARRLGQPAAGVTIHLRRSQPGESAPGLVAPESVVTDANGRAVVSLRATDPDNPRGPIDGEVFAMNYSTSLESSGQLNLENTGLSGLDAIVVHVRDRFEIPDVPEFHRDIEPIMKQYARLYPIMSHHLFDLADYASLVRYRTSLLLAFQRPIHDANYMPVTRDLSAAKIATLVKWLSTPTGDPARPLHIKELSSPEAAIASAPDERDAKAAAASTALYGFEPDLNRLG